MLKRFSQIVNQDILTCGGKGASLGEMTKAGFPIPSGFVLTTSAFGINIQVWKDEVLNAFDQLNCKFVAVRSSGTKEDGNEDSFAGQFDTFLFVTKEKLIEKILECHASVKGERILAYYKSKKINPEEIKAAVVIQKMVNAESAGVCFTANPITGDTKEIMIEAGFGLGEAVVSGIITPDNYVVKNRSIQKQIFSQSKKIVLDTEKGGTKEEYMDSTLANTQKLSDKHILQLADYAKKIKEHYGKPMDIERAVKNEELFILQARPITTLEEKNNKSARIITDEGGITRHASIIAREPKKPCIIGKKHATQILKNGDFVKVDADNGVVKTIMIYPENYILSFQAGGLTPLMTDICREAFADLKALFIVENGWMKQYLRNDVVTEAGKEGIEFFNNDEKIITYINQMKSLIANFQEFYSHKIIKKNEISREDCKIFLHLVVELNKLYAITNYERSDKAFLEKENKPNITKNLEIISKYRDEARIFLNKVCFESGGYMDTVCNLLSQQFDLSRQEVNSYTQKELLKLYQGKKLKNLILYQREKIFVVDSTNEKYYRGEGAQTIRDRFIEQLPNTNILTGMTASKGKIQGQVKVIPIDYSDFEKLNNLIDTMKQGNILVADTTAPELIIACKKAGAIITNTGGMMSHAGIISRELKIPCIVGTKYATKILKDGDLVEVDADNRTVKILGQ